jgi:hypothetical protein
MKNKTVSLTSRRAKASGEWAKQSEVSQSAYNRGRLVAAYSSYPLVLYRATGIAPANWPNSSIDRQKKVQREFCART